MLYERVGAGVINCIFPRSNFIIYFDISIYLCLTNATQHHARVPWQTTLSTTNHYCSRNTNHQAVEKRPFSQKKTKNKRVVFRLPDDWCLNTSMKPWSHPWFEFDSFNNSSYLRMCVLYTRCGNVDNHNQFSYIYMISFKSTKCELFITLRKSHLCKHKNRIFLFHTYPFKCDFWYEHGTWWQSDYMPCEYSAVPL